jgi:hypothetical protein
MTLVFAPPADVITTSYRYLPSARVDVIVDVRDKDIVPAAFTETVNGVDVELEYDFLILAAPVYPDKFQAILESSKIPISAEKSAP